MATAMRALYSRVMTTYHRQLMHNGARAVRRNAIATLLRNVFGIERLRDGQRQVIDSVLDGSDTLAIMPTGSGKSLCYQIPARLSDGSTIVVSPLISLMKDQLEKLGELGIRFVIHLQVPANLEAYYQESGRAGRDGKDAECTLLFLQDDKRVQQFFLVRHYPQAAELKAVYQAMRELARDAPVSFERIREAIDELPASKLKICLKLLKDGRLLRQKRRLEYLLTGCEAKAAVYGQLAEVYAQKQERDREALEQMVSYAISRFCRWKVLLDYFGDEVDGFDQCGHCDNCRNPPVAAAIHDDEFEPAPDEPEPAAHAFAVGARVRVPKFDVGTVQAVAGDEITIAFPDASTRTFRADYVEPA